MKFLLYLLRFCVVCITLISVVHFQNWRMLSMADNTNPVCNTTECQKIGKLYERNMNTKGQPCTDFYDYVCHNWGIYQPKPKDVNPAVLWDMDGSLDYRALQDVRYILEDKTVSTLKDFERARQVYRMCMDIPFLPKCNASDLRNVMQTIGEFPLLLHKKSDLPPFPSFWEIHQRYLKRAGESAFFDFKIGFNPLCPSEIIVELEALASSYGAISHAPGWPKPDELKHYKIFLTDVMRNLVEKNSPFTKQLGDDIHDVIEFREKLNMNIAMQRFSHMENRIVTIKEFQDWYKAEAKSWQNIDTNWMEIIRTIYKNSSDSRGQSITDKSKVYVQFKYFAKLVELLGKTPKKVIVNHIHLYFAERHMEWNSQMQKEVEQSFTDAGVATNGAIRIRNRWKDCVESIHTTTALEEAYLSLHFQKKDKLKIQELFETSKKLLEQLIGESTWLPSKIRKISVSKVKKIKALIGYSDSNDPNRERRSEEEGTSPLLADAHYSNGLCEVFASAAYLQWPIYSPNLPYVVDYGATMNVFGHELYHAFDPDGILYDSEGTTPWWPPEGIEEHKKRTKCFSDHFGKFKREEIKKLKLPTPHDSVFTNTLDEDLADSMGLKLSYMGFQQMLKKSKGVCPVLPGFKNLGCEKLFFISFANSFCSSLSPHQQEMLLLEDSHSMPRLRVNGAVANMKEFSAAFGCKINDPLYLNHTCDLWK